MIRAVIFFSALILLTATIPQAAHAQHNPLSIELYTDKKESRSGSIKNLCLTTHTWKLAELPETKWFKLIGERSLTIRPGESKDFVVEFDSSGLDAGTYLGEVSALCSDCPDERGCLPLKFAFPVQLKVLWSRAELASLQADEYVAGQILVGLKAESSKEVNRIVRELENKYQLKSLKVIRLSSIGRTLVLFVILNPNDEVPPVISKMAGDADVDSIQPNYRYTTFAAQTQNYENAQYGPQQIKARPVWRYSTGKDIRIALVDTGIDDEHKDLRGRVIDRRNFTDDEEYRQDAHGTIMAGIIAAISHNGFGINGVAPNAKIISIKVLKQTPRGTPTAGDSATVVQGVNYAIEKRVNVINMSFGAPKRDSEVARIVEAAVRRGTVVVAAAGDKRWRGRLAYPAALDEVIAVSAVDSNNSFYASGVRGDYIDLTAPGVNILSTLPGNIFQPSTGTSEAAAHVTGVVALLLAKRPHTSPARIKALLEENATDLDPRGRDNLFGSGLINACKSLEALLKGSRICTDR